MKTTMKLLGLLVMLAMALCLNGCVIHEHSAACGHYYQGGHWYYAPHHVHGPGCGHELRGGVWVAVP